MAKLEEWKARLIKRLGGVVPDRKTFVVDAQIERAEEMRVDYLGPGADDLDDGEPWVAPEPARGDKWRPTTNLSHVRWPK